MNHLKVGQIIMPAICGLTVRDVHLSNTSIWHTHERAIVLAVRDSAASPRFSTLTLLIGRHVSLVDASAHHSMLYTVVSE